MKHNTGVMLTILTILMGCMLFSALASTAEPAVMIIGSADDIADIGRYHALAVQVGTAPYKGMKMVYQSMWVDGATLHVRSVLEPCTVDSEIVWQPYETVACVAREVTRVDSRVQVAPDRGALRGTCVTVGEMLFRTAFPSAMLLGN